MCRKPKKLMIVIHEGQGWGGNGIDGREMVRRLYMIYLLKFPNVGPIIIQK